MHTIVGGWVGWLAVGWLAWCLLFLMHAWMDGWMDGWMEGGWMEGRVGRVLVDWLVVLVGVGWLRCRENVKPMNNQPTNRATDPCERASRLHN